MLTPPIPVVLPLLVAALLAGLSRVLPRWLSSAISILTCATVACVAVSMVGTLREAEVLVYWFGGWAPRNGAAVGVGFTIDNTGAMLVLLVGILATMALLFASRYFDTVGTFFHVLMLVFVAGVSGFALSGDLFNLFVFFELMSAAAFALCGYKSEEAGPLQGALNFAVTNTIGAFLVLSGIGLLYGRTGALNMAQMGRVLAGEAPDALVMAALAFVMCGFLVKAAVVPFHFWLADAHAVAPAPVCVLFSGVMVELGLYAAVRVYWVVFSGAMAAYQDNLRNLLMAFAVVTAILGAVMCYSQRHLKRLLAFSTISHVGLMLAGIALLTPRALGGTELYVMGHAMVKGGLFLVAGILLHRTGSVDELDLHGRCRHMRSTGVLFFLGAAGLAGLPPFATFWGSVMIDGSAEHAGYGWLPWLGMGTAVITSAAVFRFGGRVFLGWGPDREELTQEGAHIEEQPDTQEGFGHTPFVMYAATAALIVLGMLAGLAPRVTGAAESSALYLQNRAGYAQRVLDQFAPYPPTVHDSPATTADTLRSFGGVAAAMLLAWGSLCSRRLRRMVRQAVFLRQTVKGLRTLHSGIIPDYVTWLVTGVAVFGATTYFWIQ